MLVAGSYTIEIADQHSHGQSPGYLPDAETAVRRGTGAARARVDELVKG
jgi:hypothetical protein